MSDVSLRKGVQMLNLRQRQMRKAKVHFFIETLFAAMVLPVLLYFFVKTVVFAEMMDFLRYPVFFWAMVAFSIASAGTATWGILRWWYVTRGIKRVLIKYFGKDYNGDTYDVLSDLARTIEYNQESVDAFEEMAQKKSGRARLRWERRARQMRKFTRQAKDEFYNAFDAADEYGLVKPVCGISGPYLRHYKNFLRYAR